MFHFNKLDQVTIGIIKYGHSYWSGIHWCYHKLYIILTQPFSFFIQIGDLKRMGWDAIGDQSVFVGFHSTVIAWLQQ